MDYADANHPPIVKAVSSNQLAVQAGEKFELEVTVSDPDGDQLETKFWIYKEVGTYAGQALLSVDGNSVSVSLDSMAVGQLHIIAEVKDNGTHPMTRYQRFVIAVN